MPYPLKDGGAIAMFNMTKGLADAGADMTLLVPLTSKHDLDLDQLPLAVKNLAEIHSQRINSDITTMGAFRNLFTKKPYYLSRYLDNNFKTKLRQLLEDNTFDIILIESLKVSMYLPVIRQYSKAMVVLRSHNVEHLIWKRLAVQSNGLKKYFLDVMVSRLKKYEIKILNDFDAIASITSVDADFFEKNGCKTPIIITPSGIDFDQFVADRKQIKPNTLFHLGALDWLPNIEAIEWFLTDVWPVIFREYSHLHFHIAGRNMPSSLRSKEIKGVKLLGEVENAHAFINENEIMIVPLLSGSGMRIKVVEGMALGKCIISTSIGAEGIGCENGKNILIANNRDEFLEQIRLLQSDKDLARKIGQEAIAFVKENYDNKKIIDHLLSELKELNKNTIKHK